MAIADILMRGVAAHKSGDLDTAAKAYRELLEAEPEHPDGLHFSGLLASQQGDPDTGAALIRRSLALHPNNPGAQNNLGNILKGQDRPEEAEACYRAALALNPDHADSLNNLGLLLRGKGVLTEALEVLEHAVSVAPRHAEAWNSLGLTSMLAGRLEQAADAFEASIDLGTTKGPDPVWHARVLCALGREARAVAHLEAHIAANPDDPMAPHQLAAILGQAEDRAPDGYVKTHFDDFAQSFDDTLRQLDYQAPEAVGTAAAAWAALHPGLAEIVDLGCGTGLCGPHLRPLCQKLTGVDLSPGMLERARGRDTYDTLIEAELVSYLQGRAPGSVPLAVSADTLIYFGALEGVMAALFRALAPGGALIATFEHLATDTAEGYQVDKSGRYAHSAPYLRRTVTASGLALSSCEELVLRKEMGKDVDGLLVVAQRPDA